MQATMEILEESVINGKVSDSGYSNSCSNSRSRRSHSSKSTHSGSNSSGSSGYGGKTTTSHSSNSERQQTSKRSKGKALKKKKASADLLPTVIQDVSAEDENDGFVAPTSKCCVASTQTFGPITILPNDDNGMVDAESATAVDKEFAASTRKIFETEAMDETTCEKDEFSCVVCLKDGVVISMISDLNSSLGFPKDMWIGRSFIHFVHPKDYVTVASQIVHMPVPVAEIANLIGDPPYNKVISTLYCRIRLYRGLSRTGFSITDKPVAYKPFQLKTYFKKSADTDKPGPFLIIKGKLLQSAFKEQNEVIIKPTPFIINHRPNGSIAYVDQASVPYLGYLPQDLIDKCALELYHPDDLPYLKKVYETLVKAGSAAQCRPYRMLVQNGDYVTLETSWTCHINPWTRRLEYVIASHSAVEGPSNPDVFESPDITDLLFLSDKEKAVAQCFRGLIVRTLNTEQNSVMPGGVPPQRGTQISTDTPLTYTQLNYDDNIQRFFDSNHKTRSNAATLTVLQDNLMTIETDTLNLSFSSPEPNGNSAEHISSSDSNGMLVMDTSSGDSLSPSDCQQVPRLTVSLLSKHNIVMEKALAKKHWDNRSTKTELDKTELRMKKKEHLARCNATHQPVPPTGLVELQPLKRNLSQISISMENAQKHYKPTPREAPPLIAAVPPTPHLASLPPQRATLSVMPSVNGLHATYDLTNQHIPQHHSSNIRPLASVVPLVSPVPAAIPGITPMYYIPTAPNTIVSNPSTATTSAYPTPVQYMLYMPMFGATYMYPPVNPQMACQTHPMPAASVKTASKPKLCSTNTIVLPSSNYEQACNQSGPLTYATMDKRSLKLQREPLLPKDGTSPSPGPLPNALERSSEAVPDSKFLMKDMTLEQLQSDENTDKTDGETSSSFYSSFFRTDWGSAEDSTTQSEGRLPLSKGKSERSNEKAYSSNKISENQKKGVHTFYPENYGMEIKKTAPLWMDKAYMTSDVMLKYQMVPKSLEEVLKADQEILNTMKQPTLVNEQLDQLYLELQLEGVESRLMLEEGLTSSCSSGDDTPSMPPKCKRKKRHYSKLAFIHEEDAPIPPPNNSKEPSFV